MNALRRAWRVLASVPESRAAYFFAFLIVFWSAGVALGFVTGWDWLPPLERLIDVGWAYAALWFVRERDQARAELKRTSLT
ncbi:hypothetical protein [Streptomyces sp.]|uniref:hypothetical protein n=1 Tax=Streptomyces sp. TaxID=1931 RepID=UPI002F9467F6